MIKKSPYETAFSAFANIIYDVGGLNKLLDDIELVERSLFKNKEGTISAKAKDYLTGAVINVFAEIEKMGLEPTDDQKQLQFLKDLTSFLNGLPQVRLTIAFDPTVSYVMKLNNQISTLAGKKVILDITVDDKIVAGAIFEYNGRILEQTLQEKLETKLSGLIEKLYPVKGAVVPAA